MRIRHTERLISHTSTQLPYGGHERQQAVFCEISQHDVNISRGKITPFILNKFVITAVLKKFENTERGGTVIRL